MKNTKSEVKLSICHKIYRQFTLNVFKKIHVQGRVIAIIMNRFSIMLLPFSDKYTNIWHGQIEHKILQHLLTYQTETFLCLSLLKIYTKCYFIR